MAKEETKKEKFQKALEEVYKEVVKAKGDRHRQLRSGGGIKIKVR